MTSIPRDAALFRIDTEWMNALILQFLPPGITDKLPFFVQTWIRNYVFGMGLYLIVGALWCYYVYFCFRFTLFKDGIIPQITDILQQIRVASLAMPMYAMLPTVTDVIVESGWTRSYPRVDDVGLPLYVGYFFVYMLVVEFGVYWMHRLLHEIRPLYDMLHAYHHIYNKQHTLSPFAGLAFHPVDGILQAFPYTIALFIVPMHYLTHLMLLFLTGVWTTNIHDCVDAKIDPVMGAGYHTIHHTSYKDNYGHYFIFMDWLFGTLLTPEDYEEQKLKSRN